jgi:hypothetical protein
MARHLSLFQCSPACMSSPGNFFAVGSQQSRCTTAVGGAVLERGGGHRMTRTVTTCSAQSHRLQHTHEQDSRQRELCVAVICPHQLLPHLPADTPTPRPRHKRHPPVPASDIQPNKHIPRKACHAVLCTSTTCHQPCTGTFPAPLPSRPTGACTHLQPVVRCLLSYTYSCATQAILYTCVTQPEPTVVACPARPSRITGSSKSPMAHCWQSIHK